MRARVRCTRDRLFHDDPVSTKLLFLVDALKIRRLWVTRCPAQGLAHARVAFWPALVDNPSFPNPTEF
jgi:hypothetical protein